MPAVHHQPRVRGCQSSSRFSFSWDEQIFFIFDHMQLQAESDDLNDAIVFFMPSSTDVSTQCALCGQLMGMVTFFKHMTGAPPVEFMLQKCRFTLKHFGRFTMAMSETRMYTGHVVGRQLEKLHQLFTFYQQSLEDVYEDSGGDFKMFQSFVQEIFATYVPYVWRFSDLVAAAFESLPSVEPARCGTNVLLEASDVLQRIKRMPNVFAGCIFFHNRVLCSQLDSELTSHLLLIQQQQMEFPCQRIQPEFDLPHGVCLLSVYLTEEQMKLLSPFSSRPPRTYNHDTHRTGSNGRLTRSSTSVKTKPTVLTPGDVRLVHRPTKTKPTPGHFSTKPDFVPSLSPDTTSEEECAGTWFQTEAVVHSECTCHAAVDGSQLRTCIRHDHTSNETLESGVRTTHETNANRQIQPPGHLSGCCVAIVKSETIESATLVTESKDMVAHYCTVPSESRREPECTSTYSRYSQSPSLHSSHTTVIDDCVRLPEEIGNLPYDVSYDMDYDKLNLETQSALDDDMCRNHSGMRRKSDFESPQNDSGVLEDCSPRVKVGDHSENSTSDLDLTGDAAGSCLCRVTAENQGDGLASCYGASVTETALKKAVDEGHFTGESTMSPVGDTHNRSLTATESPAGTSETDGLENESEKSLEAEHDGRKNMSVESENESTKTSVESGQGSCENETVVEVRNQDGVKHEATIVVDIEAESEHSSRTENENDEVKKQSDLKLEAMLEETTMLNVETESEYVEAEKENTDMNVDINRDGSKHEETHEATTAVDVKTESEHAIKTDNKTDVKTESEHIRLKTVHDEIKDDKQVVQTENKDVVVKSGDVGKEKEVDVIYTNCSHDEADNSSLVEYDCDYNIAVISKGPCPCVIRSGTASRSHDTGDNDKYPSETSPNDNIACTERGDNSHVDVTQSEYAVVEKDDKLHQNMLPSNSEMIGSCHLALSHGDGDSRCVGESEKCCPSVLRGDRNDMHTETDDSRVRDGANLHDTATQSGVVNQPDVQSSRPPHELVNVDLFVQTNSDLMLLLLMEDGVTSHEETVTDVWRAVTPQLASLDYSIKQSMKGREPSPEADESNYNYLTFNTFTDQLSGKIAMPTDLQQPMSALESNFCDTAILLHEEFHTSETLKEVTLRNHTTSVYGCSVLGQETFFQLKKTRSGSQTPSEKDISMCIDKEASRSLLKNHHIQTM